MKSGQLIGTDKHGHGIEPLSYYWTAQMLSTPWIWLKGWDSMTSSFSEFEIADMMGLEESELESRCPPGSLADFVEGRSLEALLEEDYIHKNVARLAGVITLSPAEMRLLVFLCHADSCPALGECVRFFDGCGQRMLIGYLAGLLGVGTPELVKALQPDATLRATGMLSMRSGGWLMRMSLVELFTLDRELVELLHAPGIEARRLVEFFYQSASPSVLMMEDFVEIRGQIEMLVRLLGKASDAEREGINILIYGPPGTGKSQLARLLAEQLGWSLALVPETDKQGDSLPGSKRLARLNACQRLLKLDSRSLILFDEAEETLLSEHDGSLFFRSPRRNADKAVLTRTLEGNVRPVIWVANNIQMDPALLRRFTHILHLNNPGPVQRKRLVSQALENVTVGDVLRRQLLKLESLSPAMLRSSIDFADFAADTGADKEQLIAMSVNSRLEAMGSCHRVNMNEREPLHWREECLRASEDVGSLLAEIDPDQPVRLCLYGPPGTGKSAWAQQLAMRLGRPLMAIQASDLLDAYVGETEKQIASMFHHAERDGAVLVIDEADSFMSSRQHAQRSWEISQVNQFLASLERYEGIFVATTNMLERFDHAAMRRFDFVVRFDCLDINAATLLMRDVAASFSVVLPDDGVLSQMLAGLDSLTPGDFAVLHRQLQVRRMVPDASSMVSMLTRICSHKHPESAGKAGRVALH